MKVNRKKFKDLGIKTKLGSILLLFALVALFNYFSVSYFKHQQESDAAVVDAAGRQRMLSQRMAFFAEMISCGKEQVREELRKVVDLHDISLNALKMGGVAPGIGGDKALPPTKSSIMPALLAAEDLWVDYKTNAEIILDAPLYVDSIKVIDKIDSAGSMTQNRQQFSALNPVVASAIAFIEENATEMLNRNNTLVSEYVKDSEGKQQSLTYFLWIMLAVSILLIVAGFYIIEKFIIKPARLVKQGAQHLAKGDLSKKIPYESDDEIGSAVKNLNTLSDNLEGAALFAQAIGEGTFSAELQAISDEDKLRMALIGMRDQLLEVAREDKKRSWAREGLSQLGDILRGDQTNLEAFAQNVITYLVKYIEANQGALFVINDDKEEDVHMELLALYAWGKKKFINKRIEKGEGVAGTVWQEGEITYLTDVPENYVEITSGLGKANPRSIVVIPLKSDEEVVGIIELASFKEYEEYQIEFIKKLAENAASTISTSKVNHRTKLLLEQTQQQAEEMRAQEEEIRQNMEELSATQESVQRNSAEMKSRIDAIDESGIASVEFEMDGTIVNANPPFLTLMQYDWKEIEGKHHSMFVTPAYAQSEEYRNFWANLRQGIPQPGEYVRIAKDGSKVYIYGSYSLIRDSDKKPVRVLKFATDITDMKNMNEEFRQQEKEIRAQEEEMRQNLEELSATQEEMKRKEQEYLQVIQTLEEKLDTTSSHKGK